MGVKKIIETGLQTIGGAAFGKGLIAAAQKQNREALQGAVVGKVQEILVHISKQRDYIAQSHKNVELLESQVRAIEAGEFSVSTYGVISFTDKELQVGEVRMTECPNCGYSGRRSV